MNSLIHRGWTITPRTFQIRGGNRWTLDIVIAYREKQRAFSGPQTYPNERAAIRGCYAFGRRIIDGRVPYCTLNGLR
jgi:hypothetical protein